MSNVIRVVTAIFNRLFVTTIIGNDTLITRILYVYRYYIPLALIPIAFIVIGFVVGIIKRIIHS